MIIDYAMEPTIPTKQKLDVKENSRPIYVLSKFYFLLMLNRRRGDNEFMGYEVVLLIFRRILQQCPSMGNIQTKNKQNDIRHARPVVYWIFGTFLHI